MSHVQQRVYAQKSDLHKLPCNLRLVGEKELDEINTALKQADINPAIAVQGAFHFNFAQGIIYEIIGGMVFT